ncbi:hypothetical protein [Deinococcus fonticola]|uniref:hypothetical protein n=1 Tax=Deinococcus fonticola TaxID=2528713 RepID=UPI0010753FDA|nr:hypothetical protein [Deinococcus fonticola]
MSLLQLCRRMERELRPLLGIGKEWSIRWSVRDDDEEDGNMGTCVTRVDYRIATINLWPDRIDDHAELVDTIAHELCHISHWPFTAFAEVLEQGVDGPVAAMIDRAWTRAQEEYISAVMMQRPDIREVIRKHAGSPL